MAAKDLRVALFSGNYNYVQDGANQALNRLMGSALQAGAAVRVYSPTTDAPAFEPTGDLVSVPSWRMPGGRGEYRLAKGLTAEVEADLKRFAPNIVHVSAPDILGHRAATWALGNGIPVIASHHTRFETYARYYGIGFIEGLLIWIQKRFYNRVDHAMVPSASVGAMLREWGVTTPTGTWARGINHERFNPERRDNEWRRSLGIGDDEVAVGFLGRLVLEKGLDVFADVIAELKKRGVPHRVLVIGEGPARPWFAERVPEAVFTGFQAGDDLGRATASMDIFFMPSVTESFGNVTCEAMAAGVPVVAARATGNVDLVADGETGFLVEPRDIGGYADAIARLIERPELRVAAGKAGHARVQFYDWDQVNAVMIAAYEELRARGSKAMSDIAKDIGRRIVTGHDATGKSIILSDGVPLQNNPMTGNGADFIEIWSSAEAVPTLTPAPAGEPALRDFTMMPATGHLIRIIDVYPASEGGSATPMHRTETLDYAVVIEGEITLILDDSEAVLGPGSVIVQNGTDHAWENRTDKRTRMAFFHIAAAFSPELRSSLPEKLEIMR